MNLNDLLRSKGIDEEQEHVLVLRLEASWNQRLHTREPYGLNDN